MRLGVNVKTKPFVEIVTERINGFVLASNIRDVTDDDIKQAEELHKQGKCPHNVVVDTLSYMYDFRECYTCGKGLGTV